MLYGFTNTILTLLPHLRLKKKKKQALQSKPLFDSQPTQTTTTARPSSLNRAAKEPPLSIFKGAHSKFLNC